MKVAIQIEVQGQPLRVAIDDTPPLGWRFWTFGGFAGDPLEPRSYGGSRGIPLCMVETDRGERWLTAMELDGSAQLFLPHELFTCSDQAGAGAFGRAWLERHAEQPGLL